jgi:hypothetical protein
MRPALLLITPLFLAARVDSSTHTGLRNNVPIEASRVAKALPTDPVLQWNRELLKIVRTPGVQPSTIHPTRSFAMMHGAIYDAVNSIDRRHRAYAVLFDGVSRHASKEAAAASAAHDVLAALYPSQHAALDDQLQTSLGTIPASKDKRDGIAVGSWWLASETTSRTSSRAVVGASSGLVAELPNDGAARVGTAGPGAVMGSSSKRRRQKRWM